MLLQYSTVTITAKWYCQGSCECWPVQQSVAALFPVSMHDDHNSVSYLALRRHVTFCRASWCYVDLVDSLFYSCWSHPCSTSLSFWLFLASNFGVAWQFDFLKLAIKTKTRCKALTCTTWNWPQSHCLHMSRHMMWSRRVRTVYSKCACWGDWVAN